MTHAQDDQKLLYDFGFRIKSIRNDLSISQEELGIRAGLHRTYIGMIERGEKNITLINIVRLAEGLGVTLGELFGDD